MIRQFQPSWRWDMRGCLEYIRGRGIKTFTVKMKTITIFQAKSKISNWNVFTKKGKAHTTQVINYYQQFQASDGKSIWSKLEGKMLLSIKWISIPFLKLYWKFEIQKILLRKGKLLLFKSKKLLANFKLKPLLKLYKKLGGKGWNQDISHWRKPLVQFAVWKWYKDIFSSSTEQNWQGSLFWENDTLKHMIIG